MGENQNFITGKVVDKETKDPLPAYVSIQGSEIGTSADYDGTFKLNLESTQSANEVILEVFQVGYKRMEVSVRIGGDVLIEMDLEPLPTHQVTVTADSMFSEDSAQKTVTLKRMDVYTLPGTAADPLYATQLLPGVNSQPDSSSILIRGGAADEVAYFYDGIEIEHPFLTGSLHEAYFSIFDNQVIEGFRVSTSGFHPKYGDALSGIMDINAKNDINSGEGGLGLSIMGLNSYVGLPINKIGSLVASYNRGHSGLMTRINGHEENEFETEHASAKLNLKINKSNTLKIQALKDNYDFAQDSGFSTNSDNLVAGFSLTSSLSKKLVSILTLSRVSHQVFFDIEDVFQQAFKDVCFQARWDASLDLGRHYFDFGADIQRRDLNFSYDLSGNGLEKYDVQGTRYGLYMSDKFRLSDKFYLTVGGRASSLSVKETSTNFDPRVSLAYFITQNDVLRVSAGYHHQFGDYFVLAENNLKAKNAGHISFTYDKITDPLDLRVTVYNKEYRNLFLSEDGEEGEVSNNGLGFGRGAELYIKWKQPRYDTFLVYNYLDSQRKENEVLVLTTSPYEITHSLTGIFKLKFDSVNLGVRFSYATGLPYTPLAGREWDAENETYVPNWGVPFSSRFPSYQRMDLNGSKSFIFQNRMLIFYFGITNLLNRKNILHYEYSSDYSARNNSYSIFGRSIFLGIYVPFF
ncbi:MAG: TonB-dependent receptor [Candidatus Aminicenantes bacterium]|nr:TonB-dependent receptor [Candidatus Aminicenantes bacterium]